METAYVLMSCEIGTEHDLLLQLKKIEGVKDVTITYGDYDLVVETETENESKMNELISAKIRKLEKIRSTVTLRVIS
ncbi:MAG: Lrp/AsnC ligand binding domain-containing protein [Nitrosopumilaceae archaeon]|jgi:DNA-binding Lrp family transcriptional regulator|nr:Lrp/AsnC ligand binding domain-containing protein [Nitrosopumilales archaeon]MDP2667680.1 Lrp/AsnC ligand binding domain-containing protein [Nitrosopumilaceae archaeon]